MTSTARKIGSVAGYLLAVAAVGALILEQALFAHGPVGIALQVLAAALMVWARVTFGRRSFHLAANPTAGPLVTWGPYRFVRNPIYSALILFTAAGVASHFSGLHLGLFALVAAGLTARSLLEEAELRRVYGDEYAAYAARTARLVPWIF